MRRFGCALVFGLATMGFSAVPRAIDHGDSASVAANPSADIADVFGFVSSDGSKVVLAMTVNPNATGTSKFAADTMYVFHTASRASVSSTQVALSDIVCSFDAAQKIACAVGDGSVTLTGDASQATGLSRTDGKLKVFAGLRRDPSFANTQSLSSMRAAAKLSLQTAATADAAGCKATSDRNAQSALASSIVNSFATSNVLALVVEVDKTLITRAGPILSVWAATHKRAKTN